MSIEPLNVPSLKDACIRRLEELILSGQLKIGERLPAERDLAASLNISRPALHEALLDLAAKGLVEIRPRRGVYVCDYRVTGSLAILNSLIDYHEGNLSPDLVDSMIGLRQLLEAETARLAALQRQREHLQRLKEILAAESELSNKSTVSQAIVESLTELDFQFHHQVALASGNMIYPLILNSFKNVYTNLSGRFFQLAAGSPVVAQVIDFHSSLVDAIQLHNPQKAAAIMSDMLYHGEKFLKGVNGYVRPKP